MVIFNLALLFTLLDPALVNAQPTISYNRDILPILAEHCFQCHGPDTAARQAGLRLDHWDGTKQHSDGSQVIVPGDPQASQLWIRVTSQDEDQVMPPANVAVRLSDQAVENLRLWISQGANYQAHWAFLPPVLHELPENLSVKATNPVDVFVRTQLAAASILPSEAASRATLVRRLALDLLGLPPTLDQMDSFLNDNRPDAYQRLIDRFLASPHFGERWARWWLDLAHYADSDGYLQDFVRPNAWRYRQWVIEALNDDLPFDQFTIQQIAGDQLNGEDISQKIATGFLRNTLSNREGGADLEEYRVRQVIDRTTTVGTTWLALTIGCAECHDHKFDPLSQREFFQMYAFFNSADEVNIDAPLSDETQEFESAYGTYAKQRDELLQNIAESLHQLQQRWEDRLKEAAKNPGADHRWDRQLEVLGLIWGQGLGEGQLEGINILQTPLEKRTRRQQDRLTDYFLKHGEMIDPAKFRELKINEYTSKLDEIAKTLPQVSRAPVMTQAVVARPTHLHTRGDFRRPSVEVHPDVPSLFKLASDAPRRQRLELAQWLVSPQNPLTARVLVNRLWQELFGRGIVATSENFGVRGERPSHPELLDWLAIHMIDSGWSIKNMIRTIVSSETYQQQSSIRSDVAQLDPQNRLLSRQNRVRLSAESVRDAALLVSGLLDRRLGGPSLFPPQPDSVSMEGFDNRWITSQGANRYRRTVYTFLQRTSPFSQSVTFDFPDTARSCTRRERSNTPLQALNLLNDPAFVEMALSLAETLLRQDSAQDDQQRLECAVQLTLSRQVLPAEVERLSQLLRQQRLHFRANKEASQALVGSSNAETDCAELAAWTVVASVLLNLDEFIVRE